MRLISRRTPRSAAVRSFGIIEERKHGSSRLLNIEKEDDQTETADGVLDIVAEDRQEEYVADETESSSRG